MSEEVSFVDILKEPRSRQGILAYSIMTRAWDPQKSYVLDKCYSPQDLKDLVANSVYMDAILEAESARTGESKAKLNQEVLEYLEEMGLDKKLYIIRWMGIVFLKFSYMMKVGIFVNETALLKLKSSMGKNPVLFLPTHRSYADFCLLTYLCYHYEIDFPAVAAGMDRNTAVRHCCFTAEIDKLVVLPQSDQGPTTYINTVCLNAINSKTTERIFIRFSPMDGEIQEEDFYSMAVVGRRMRETCAFYIRRTLAGAPLYAATLRQYVRTLVAKHCASIEFFLEGTRSRSNKSLSPKYGMLSMSLVPYFTREVSDVTIVPVNISYDRLMETSLFAYEHLGVPKPKESTGGFLKAIRSLNDHFGNIYINMGTPLSVKEYLKSDSHSKDTLQPVDLQQLNPEQFSKVQDIANHVITLQQKSTVATISNLLALVLMQSLIKNKSLVFEEIISETEWMIQILRSLGALVFENDVKSSVERILVVHSMMMELDADRRLRLLSSKAMNVSEDVKLKMKGHTLKSETMVNAVSVIQLQLYVNPVIHYLVPPALVCLLAQRGGNREQLATDYSHIRKLLRHEFFHVEKDDDIIFTNAIDYCVQNGVITRTDSSYVAGEDHRSQYLLKWAVWPALTTLLKCMEVLTKKKTCEHKKALKFVQEYVESSHCHPYCLSLESIANCLQGLTLAGALQKERGPQVIYYVVPDRMEQSRYLVSSILPNFIVDFGSNNSVILDCSTVVCKL